MKELKSYILNSLRSYFLYLLPFIFSFYSCLLIFRFYDFFKFLFFSSESGIKVGYLLGGIFLDFIIANVFVLLISIVFSLFYYRKIINGFIHVFLLMALIMNMILIEVFQITHELLDELFFRFSLNELKVIVGTDGFNLFNILKFVILISFYFLFYYLFKKINVGKKGLIVFVSLSVLCIIFINKALYAHEKQIATKLVNNKFAYFSVKSIKYFFEEDKIYQRPNIKNNQILGYKIDDEEYPFMHKFELDSTFASYFKKENKKLPNIVIIIVESLGTNFIGKYSNKYGNILPFLDSLSKKSLYFPHILSTSERTFNVLPAIIGSTPFSPEKKILMSMEIPQHLNLVGLLSRNYFSRFYCGVYLDFNDMRNYLFSINTNYLVHSWEKQFNEKFSSKNIWGYPDQQLFEKSFVDDSTRHKKLKMPKLDIFLTISTHYPHIFPNMNIKVKSLKDEILRKKFPNKNKNHVLKNIEGFASFRYLDESLRNYFEKEIKSDDYNNTIYIITGDHGSELNNENSLNKITVPLIIHSKLLKKSETFNAISGHNDILPSLLSLLKINYLYNLPNEVSFVGNKLNMNQNTFNKFCFYPSITTNYHHKILLQNNYFLYNDEFYKVDKNLNLIESNDEKAKKKLLKNLSDFSKISSYCTFNDKIINKEKNKSWLNTIEYKLFHYSNKEYINSKDEFIFIDDNKHYEKIKKCKLFRYVIEGEIFIENNIKVKKLPKFTSALTYKDSVLFWRQSDYVFPSVIAKNSWNKFKITLDYISNELYNLDNFKLNHYFLNIDKINVRIKNFKLVTYVRE